MNEAQWVELVAGLIQPVLNRNGHGVRVQTGLRLAYGHEIAAYGAQTPLVETTLYQTDLALVEDVAEGSWRPRVVVEAKVDSVTTHDAITYSQKAAAHRAVHPYLRYGIMLGNRKHFPLPGRLYRHGAQFDFMISFKEHQPNRRELATFVDLLAAEVAASRTLEKLLYQSRKVGRDRYSVLHRKLEVR